MKLRAVAVAHLALCLAAVASAEGEEQPLVLDGRSGVTLAANPAFDASAAGSVDVWMAALWTSKPAYDPCLVALRGPGEDPARTTRFSVHVSAARDRIGFFNGRSWGWLPFDFSDGEYHHVGVATEGASTRVVVDGRALGEIPLGFGSGRGAPLRLGSTDGASDPFVGAVLSLRLWNAALSAEQLARLAEVAGPPGRTDPLAQHLLAWAEFSAKDQTIHLAGAAAEAPGPSAASSGASKPDAAPAAGGEPTLAADFDLAGVWVKQNTRVFEKEQVAGVADDDHGRYRSYPVFLVEPRDAVVVDLDTAAFGPGGGQAFADELPAGGRIAELRIATSVGVDALQLVVADATGQLRERLRRGAQRADAVRHIFTLDAGEQLVGFSGTSDDTRITSLRVHTDRRSSEVFGNESGAFFELALPAGAAATGLSGSAGRELTSLALRYRGRAQSLALLLDDGSLRTFAPRSPREYVDGKSTLVAQGADLLTLDGVVFERVPPYAAASETKSTYGDPFAISNQLYNVEYSFRSYDITRLDPFDFKQFGVGQLVFRFPDEASKDWYVRNKAMIPHGVEFVTRDSGGTKTTTELLSSERSYQETLARSISVNAGISKGGGGGAGGSGGGGGGGPFSASFSRNESYKQSVQHMYANETSYTFGEARMAAYALVLDKARVVLDDGFRKRALALVKSRDYRGMIEAYGTHYPYAVTYGGRGILRMELNKETYSKMLSEGVDITTNASLTLKAVSAGASVSESQDVSDSFKHEMSTQVDSFRWIGGSAGFGKESWQVGDKVTPVFLDLRPLDELLGPPFFSLAEIPPETRKGLAQAISAYLASAPKPREESVRPETYGIEIERIEVARSGELDRIAELAGTLAIRGFVPNGKSELPGEPVVWSAESDKAEAVKDTTSYFLQARGAPARRLFAVSKDDVTRGGYAVVEAHLVEQDAGIERIAGEEPEDFGTVQSTKLYWRTMPKPPGSTGVLKLQRKGCTGLCPDLRVHYRWMKH